ncbi:unnamed protein product [Cylicostephanus goldi]|uniref:Uncharacterized protein n=1 Tax=Cylicostephanus goldi TaxID=71465 RepID=A0A3P6R8A9_CYLGO|nr:unnamed protein product [Cylicostephanus goldi]
MVLVVTSLGSNFSVEGDDIVGELVLDVVLLPPMDNLKELISFFSVDDSIVVGLFVSSGTTTSTTIAVSVVVLVLIRCSTVLNPEVSSTPSVTPGNSSGISGFSVVLARSKVFGNKNVVESADGDVVADEGDGVIVLGISDLSGVRVMDDAVVAEPDEVATGTLDDLLVSSGVDGVEPIVFAVVSVGCDVVMIVSPEPSVSEVIASWVESVVAPSLSSVRVIFTPIASVLGETVASIPDVLPIFPPVVASDGGLLESSTLLRMEVTSGVRVLVVLMPAVDTPDKADVVRFSEVKVPETALSGDGLMLPITEDVTLVRFWLLTVPAERVTSGKGVLDLSFALVSAVLLIPSSPGIALLVEVTSAVDRVEPLAGPVVVLSVALTVVEVALPVTEVVLIAVEELVVPVAEVVEVLLEPAEVTSVLLSKLPELIVDRGGTRNSGEDVPVLICANILVLLAVSVTPVAVLLVISLNPALEVTVLELVSFAVSGVRSDVVEVVVSVPPDGVLLISSLPPVRAVIVLEPITSVPSEVCSNVVDPEVPVIPGGVLLASSLPTLPELTVAFENGLVVSVPSEVCANLLDPMVSVTPDGVVLVFSLRPVSGVSVAFERGPATSARSRVDGRVEPAGTVTPDGVLVVFSLTPVLEPTVVREEGPVTPVPSKVVPVTSPSEVGMMVVRFNEIGLIVVVLAELPVVEVDAISEEVVLMELVPNSPGDTEVIRVASALPVLGLVTPVGKVLVAPIPDVDFELEPCAPSVLGVIVTSDAGTTVLCSPVVVAVCSSGPGVLVGSTLMPEVLVDDAVSGVVSDLPPTVELSIELTVVRMVPEDDDIVVLIPSTLELSDGIAVLVTDDTLNDDVGCGDKVVPVLDGSPSVVDSVSAG